MVWADAVALLETLDTVEEVEAAVRDPALFSSKVLKRGGVAAHRLLLRKALGVGAGRRAELLGEAGAHCAWPSGRGIVLLAPPGGRFGALCFVRFDKLEALRGVQQRLVWARLLMRQWRRFSVSG